MRYKTIHDGDVVIPVMEGYKLQCCDCGLVHRFTFAVIKRGRKRGIAFVASRDNRATAQVRRSRKPALTNPHKGATVPAIKAKRRNPGGRMK